MVIYILGKFLLNNAYQAYMLTESFLKRCLCLIIKLPKIKKVFIFLFLCITNLFSQCGDIETNPFYHYNVKGLTALDFTKIWSLQAYITQHRYDIICLWETFLNNLFKAISTESK